MRHLYFTRKVLSYTQLKTLLLLKHHALQEIYKDLMAMIVPIRNYTVLDYYGGFDALLYKGKIIRDL